MYIYIYIYIYIYTHIYTANLLRGKNPAGRKVDYIQYILNIVVLSICLLSVKNSLLFYCCLFLFVSVFLCLLKYFVARFNDIELYWNEQSIFTKGMRLVSSPCRAFTILLL